MQPRGQRAHAQDVGQLALAVRLLVVVPLLAVDVVQLDGCPGVGHGGDVNDSGGGRFFNQIEQQVRKQEVTWKNRQDEVCSRLPWDRRALWPPWFPF